MEKQPIVGMTVDLGELKKTSKIVLWGRLAKRDSVHTPLVKLKEIPVDWEQNSTPSEAILLGAFICFE